MATNQLLVASSFDEARVGCVGAAFEHYAQWKRVVGPDATGSEIDVAWTLGKAGLSEQERLTTGQTALAARRARPARRHHLAHPGVWQRA